MHQTALVIGGAACVWDDLAAAAPLGPFDAVIACNDIGAVWRGDLEAWVSLHPLKLEAWLAARAGGWRAPAKRVVSHRQEPGVTDVVPYRFPNCIRSGSSGLYAAKVAIDLGFTRVVLCGVPMSIEQSHFFDEQPWSAGSGFRPGWLEALPFITGKVRSMSGWTAGLLGRPTADWLREIQ